MERISGKPFQADRGAGRRKWNMKEHGEVTDLSNVTQVGGGGSDFGVE